MLSYFHRSLWQVSPEPTEAGPLVTLFPITDDHAIIVTSQHTALVNRSDRKILWTIACPATEAALDLERGRLALAMHGWVFVWDLQSGLLTQTLDLDVDLPTGLQFHPQGSLLAVALYADEVQLWQLADGQLLHTLSPVDGGYTSYKSLAFSPDGQLLACGEDELFMQLWNIQSGSPVSELPANLGKPVFSPDGAFLAAVGESGKISRRSFTLWDVATRSEIRRFLGHEKRIMHLAFSPSGQFLVSCSEDQTVRWWEVASGREVDCVRELFARR